MLIPLALSQPILYHSLVYTATAHFFGIDHRPPKPVIISLEHGYRAIQLVQKNLHTVPAISDETAFATALLGVTEVCVESLWFSLRVEPTFLTLWDISFSMANRYGH